MVYTTYLCICIYIYLCRFGGWFMIVLSLKHINPEQYKHCEALISGARWGMGQNWRTNFCPTNGWPCLVQIHHFETIHFMKCAPFLLICVGWAREIDGLKIQSSKMVWQPTIFMLWVCKWNLRLTETYCINGLVQGEIYTGGHGFYHDYGLFRCNFFLQPIHWYNLFWGSRPASLRLGDSALHMMQDPVRITVVPHSQ